MVALGYPCWVTDRERLFDAWASSYDGDVAGADGFPFQGYERTLAEVAVDGHEILPIGGQLVPRWRS